MPHRLFPVKRFGAASSVAGIFVEMELVQQPVDQRRKNQADDREENQPGEKRVEAGEDFAGSGGQRRDRPHAAEDHRGIEKGVDPAETFELVVTGHADKKGDGHQPRRHQQVAAEASPELRR